MNRTTTPTLIAALLMTPALAPGAFAQTDREALAKDLAALRAGQEEIRKEIGEILAGLRAKPAPAPARPEPAKPDVAGRVFDLGANPDKGNLSARLTLVEFTDYQ